MELIDGFRDSNLIKYLAEKINRQLNRKINIMEVCGGHTHTIVKFGLSQLLAEKVNFIHGPGCPVCVIPKERVDQAVRLSEMENTILVTLGDLIRVPGSKTSLIKKRAEGRDIRVVYSPFDALKVAKENPDKAVIYVAIGFETTAPLTASVIEVALRENIKNLFFHINHVLVVPAMKKVLEGDSRIDAFIAPSHVSVITGANIYSEIAGNYRIPVVVAGFEPADVLEGVLMVACQIEEGRAEVEIQYRRAVDFTGNIKARQMIDRYFCLRDSFRWRGLGNIPESALRLKPDYDFLDAEAVFGDVLPKEEAQDNPACICGDILKGIAKPFQCRLFGKSCTPSNPAGACMVSPEGACAAYYSYGGVA